MLHIEEREALIVIIEVTQEDIDNGFVDHCQLCPIALALARAGFPKPAVLGPFFNFGDDRQKVELPECCGEFIDQFDDEEPVQPFSFEIHI